MALKLKTLTGLVNAALHIKTASGIVPVNLHAKTAGGIALLSGAGTDYLALPDYAKILFTGDSLTDNGSSYSSGSIYSTFRGYYVALHGLAAGYWNLLQDTGVSGNSTTQLLARLNTDVLSKTADVVVVLIGTNDLNAGTLPPAVFANISSIAQQIVASGKKVVLVPVPHRRLSDNLNTKIDELNALTLALADWQNVFVAPVPALFNAFIDAGNHLTVTTDGLHPNDFGGLLIAKDILGTLNAFSFAPPAIEDRSINKTFSGTDGTLFSGATGIVPSSWRGYYAAPASGVGFDTTFSEDFGKNIIRITTGTTTVESANRGMLRTAAVSVPAGMYIMTCRVVIRSNASKLTTANARLSTGTMRHSQVGLYMLAPISDNLIDEVLTWKTSPVEVGAADNITPYIEFASADGFSVVADVIDCSIDRVLS